jgi:hypothetical protein
MGNAGDTCDAWNKLPLPLSSIVIIIVAAALLLLLLLSNG